MSNARVHARNLLANWIGHGASLVVLFSLSPFVVHTLGKTEYGIWSLLSVLTGYMGLFDLGARASTGRYIIVYLGRGDHKRLDETVRTGLGFFSAAGMLILAVGIVLGWGFPVFFPSSPPEYHGLVKILLPLLAMNMWLSGIAAIFSSVLTAHNRFDLSQGLNLGILAVNTAGTVLALKQGWGITGLTMVVFGCTVLAVAGNYVLACWTHPQLRVWPPALVRSRLKELFGYGSAVFVSRIASRVIGQTNLIVVGALISVAAVTTYSVGSMLVFYSWTFLDFVGVTLFPSFQAATARGDVESERWYYLRQVQLATIFGLPAYVGFIIFGRPFIHLWMGGADFSETSVNQAALVMAILSTSRLLGLHSFAPSTLFAARGMVWFDTIFTVIEALANLGLGVVLVLVFDLDLYGVALGSLIAMVLVRGLVLPWRANHVLGIRWRRFLGLAATAGVSAALFGGWCLLIGRVVPPDSWGLFVADVVAATVGYAVIAVVLLVPRSDRERLFRVVRGWAGRNRVPSEK